MRTNKYKKEILALFDTNHLLTLDVIHSALPNADYSTIFRNVQQLVKDGSIRSISTGSKTTTYEKNNSPHDHFLCTSCGDIEEIHVPLTATERKQRSISMITVEGLCDTCK